MLMPGGALHRTEALYPEAELIKTEFYSDWLTPNNLFKGFGISLFNDRRFGYLSILRSRRAGPPSTQELRLLELLTPHLQRAVQLHERFHASHPHAEPMLATIEGLSRGVIFLGRDRRVHFANGAASQILAKADGLFLDRTGSIRASDQVGLDRLISGAIAGPKFGLANGGISPGSGGVLAIARPSGSRPYCVIVAPAPSPPFGFSANHAAAMLFITDPETQSTARRGVLRNVYGLSNKEAELATRISEGERPEAAAASMGITYQTARSYLKTVFAKLGVGRQAEVAALVQKLPAAE